jgi:polar amino acid transport system substrate-binding protein
MLRACLVLLVLFFSASVAAQGLKIGISPDFPPVAFHQDGKLLGIEADNIHALEGLLAQKLEVVEMPFVELIPALNAKKIDVIMSGMSITPEREKLVTFVQPYLKVGQMAILHRDKIARFAQPWSIYREGVRIGVERGTTGAEFVERDLTDAKVVYYTNPDEAFQGLRTDEIDMYVHDAPTSWQLATSKEHSDLISLHHFLTEEYLAWAVHKDDEALADRLDSALGKLKRNGTLRYILNRWIPVTIEVK